MADGAYTPLAPVPQVAQSRQSPRHALPELSLFDAPLSQTSLPPILLSPHTAGTHFSATQFFEKQSLSTLHTLVLSASDSSTDVGLVSNLFNVSGKNTTFGAHYQRSLWRDAVSRHVLDAGIEERRLRDVVDFFGINLGTSVTTRPLSLAYRYHRLAPGDSLALGIALQNNLPGGHLNDDATYAASRLGASASWQTLQLHAHWQHELANGWMPSGRWMGQTSNGPLVASEQFGLGGQQAVRGFAEREGAGDNGLRAHLELFGPRWADKHRCLVFWDAGQSSRLNPQAGELASQTLSSFGLGWRANFDNGASLSLDAAKVLSGTVLNPQGSSRLHVAASWIF